MKNRLFLLLTSAFLLAGCFGPEKNSSNSQGSGDSSQTSSYSSETSSGQSINSSTHSSSTGSSTAGTSSNPPEGEYGYGYYSNYYGELTWTNGEDLKNKLHTIIRNGWNPLKYDTPNWETNTKADHTKFDYEYLDAVYTADDVNASLTQKEWQREHVFAATLMTGMLTSEAVKVPGRATDFHNLLAGGAAGNQSRGNKNFGVAGLNGQTITVDKWVNDGEDGYRSDPKTFEPGTKDKGRLARAIFYMATMYKDDEIEGEGTKQRSYKGLKIVEENVDYSASSECQFAIGHLSELLTWNNTYGVDYLEMQHNVTVYSVKYSKDDKAQGNRNPYVDYPGLVDYVYGSKQDQSGDLSKLKPACYDLDVCKDGLSHYAIGQAKRIYNLGETLTAEDFAVYHVKKDFTYVAAEASEYTHSLLNHTFVKDDGSSKEATITAGEQTMKYTIELDPLGSCSYNSEMKKSTISNTKVNEDQDVKYGDVNFKININAPSGFTMSNTSAGGFKMGSKTYSVTSVTLKTVNSYTVDKVFISCYAANKDSSYSLSIKVGTTEVYSGTVEFLSSAAIHGGELGSPLTGQITYTFTGSNAINLNNVAFNVVAS